MACPEGEFGVLYVAALGDAESYAIAGSDLTITKVDGGTLQFTAGTAASPEAGVTPAPAEPVDAAELVGQEWQLVAVTQQVPAFQGVVPPADQSRYTITFADDGTFSAQVDCNQLAGTYTASADGSMTISAGPMTMAMCPEGSLGDLYLVALANASGWAVEAGVLNLTLDDGGTMEFAAAAA